MSVSFSADVLPDVEVNFNNSNAAAVLRALRLPIGNARDGLVGSCSIPEMRRALIRARSSSLAPFTRESSVEYGAPREVEPGVVIARPLRAASTGLDVDGLQDRLDQIERLVYRAAAAGAKEIRWS